MLDHIESVGATQAPTLPHQQLGAVGALPNYLPTPLTSARSGSSRDPLSDTQPALRPGVSNKTLRENGIEITQLGPGMAWGLKIRFFTYEESEGGRTPVVDEKFPEEQFFRERLARARGRQKYHQKAGTSPHIFFPLGLAEAIRLHGYLIIVEGEMKALALVEAGYPAIALTGIDCFHTRGALLAELFELIESLIANGVRIVHFLGDADTALNPGFAHAAIKMRDLLGAANLDVEIRLPRMPLDLDRRKGIDDAKSDMLEADFGVYFQKLLDDADVVGERDDQADLAGRLWDRVEDSFRALARAGTDAERSDLKKRLARLANGLSDEAAGELGQLALDLRLVNKLSHFNSERKRQRNERTAEMHAKRRENLTPVPLYYCPHSRTKYAYRTSPSSITFVDRAGAINYLVSRGYSRKRPESGGLSEVEDLLTAADMRPMDFAGPVAGLSAGIYEQNGLRILVTRGPRLLTPEAGEWRGVRDFLAAKFNGSGLVAQLPYFLGWLSKAVRDLYLHRGEFSPTQALILCGPAGVGKNITQEVITELGGSRQADPFQFFAGGNFSGELLGSEHWMIADQQQSAKYADRERLKSCIKQACVNPSMSINGKNVQAINLKFYRRLTISLNDEAHALRVLPELTGDFADKLMVLHVQGGLPFGPGERFPEYRDWWSVVESELPGFLHYLLYDHEILPEHADLRYGVTSYKDAEILARMHEQSKEFLLLELLDQHLFHDSRRTLEESSKELYSMLVASNATAELAKIGCTGAVAVGRLLGSLVQSKPDRVQVAPMRNGINRFRILPAPEEITLSTEPGSPLAGGAVPSA